MNDIIVSLPILKVLLLTAGKLDARTYLHGIHFEHSPCGVLAVTTDGHRMTVARIDYGGEEFAPFTADRDMISALKSRYDVSINCAESIVRIATEHGIIQAPEIIGAWPDWRRVVPSRFSGKPASYNYDYLGDVGRATKLIGCEHPPLVQSGEKGAMVHLSPDIIIIIMPIREGQDYVAPTYPPEWLGKN